MAYEINININGDIEESGGVSSVTGVSKGNNQDKAAKDLAKYISAQTIEPFIQNVKNQVSQNIQIVTGNRELQDRVNFSFQAVQFGVNTYKNAQAGAVIGSAMGIGGGAGALIGLGLTAIGTTMQIAFDINQLNLRRNIENYQLKQLQDRQGIAYNRSRS